ncbi:MAG TPA: group I intron-associated PD-(D/E)XK endonuclease [Candidatus Acidoferrum sp.]|nr:group I intron-associated PD-(D/E)XK endonuclease [Candidatus Acidoferrum sp.]
MDGDRVDVELGELGGISIWGMAESEFESNSKSKAKSKAAGGGARSTQANSQATDGMTPKELGELAEAEFLRRALGMGMAIAKPWGESRAYDFIVDDEGRLCRVQVKAAFREGPQGGYSLRAYRSSKQCYTEKEIDALAGYAAPENAWYLFPVRVIKKVKSLKLFPGSKGRRSKFEKWREAWGVVRGRR